MSIKIAQYCYFNSPIGRILLAGSTETLLLLGLPQGKLNHTADDLWKYNEHAFKNCSKQLNEYFAGERKVFDVDYVLQGTEFQKDVLRHVAQIPYGSTSSYSDIAHKINRPKAVRAVGTANATNPLPIIIPCHRIIGKNGALTGFGGGIEMKAYLLDLEIKHSNPSIL